MEHRPIPPRDVQHAPFIDHWVLQLWGVDPDRINHAERLEDLLNKVVERLGLTRVSEHTHYFQPGVSSVIILGESHLSAHTWPELAYMHVDIVTCVPKLTGAHLEGAFREAFATGDIQLNHLEYGGGR